MTEMTSLQRVQAVLAGQMPDRLPVIPQGFLFSAKTAGYDIGEINRSPAKMAESHLLCLEKYGYDGNLPAKQRFQWFLEEYPGLIFDVNNRHIASFLSMTPETLSRMKSALRKSRYAGWQNS